MKDLSILQNGSDIRGVAISDNSGEITLSDFEAKQIGTAFTHWLSHKVNKNTFNLNIAIGCDPRTTGDSLAKGLMQGICYLGANIYYSGLSSTPAMFMSTVMPFYEIDGSIMITASHLPSDRNGFKFFTKNGGLNSEDIAEIISIAKTVQPIFDHYNYENINLMDMYSAHLRSIISNELKSDLSDFKIVIDAGNGAGGFFATDVLSKLGADVSESIFLEPNGNFPNHIPNPENPEALNCIRDKVINSGADLGIIFDTDVDRSAAIAKDGTLLSRNQLIAIAASLKCSEHPGGTVVTDSITSNQLQLFIEKKLGLKHFRYMRGYKNVINKAKELQANGEDAFLAIETSGHAAFSSNYFLDDGAYLAALIIAKAAQLKRENSDILSLIKGLNAPAEEKEFRFNISGSDFKEKGKQILEQFETFLSKSDSFKVVTPNYEGVRADFNIDGKKGWLLLRLSLHDPVMPFNIESEQPGGIEIALKSLDEFLNVFKYNDRP